jgi:hypothetical protein
VNSEPIWLADECPKALGIIDIAANDLKFSESYKASKLDVETFVGKLASDPEAFFEE